MEKRMSASVRTARGLLAAAAILVGSSAAALAAETASPAAAPPAPSAAPAAPSPPSAAAVAAADTILADLGVKQSMAIIVPRMMTELEQNVTTTRPELKDSLRQTLRAIQPEFDKSAQQAFSEAATMLASQMSEKEIQDVAAFYESPLGKKWALIEPASLQRVYEITEQYGQKWSTDILVRAREEMKKKGAEF
jgi:uncharacterized protein